MSKAIELADKIKTWREDDDHEEPMGYAFDLLNDEIEPFLRSLVKTEALIENTSTFELDDGGTIYRGMSGYEIESDDVELDQAVCYLTPQSAFSAYCDAIET